ncbi:hypothetical protein Y032_0179g726 [Ancylostoma ceylanicum]|uniref:Uncharacterized protein n=1 Tax=Ancylostoma ceylanicum TaxID=53326 RepID=A0A016STL3_9BILA|nr:hypothetical protein Y032_0179g726 [Ancylostoma ceylanicum]
MNLSSPCDQVAKSTNILVTERKGIWLSVSSPCYLQPPSFMQFKPAVELLNVPNIKQMLCLYDNKYKVVLLKAYDNNRFIGTAVTNAWRARMCKFLTILAIVGHST